MAADYTETFVPVYETIKLRKIQEYANPSMTLGLTSIYPPGKEGVLKLKCPQIHSKPYGALRKATLEELKSPYSAPRPETCT
jgi:hypothetical protein